MRRDPALLELTREAVLAAITTDSDGVPSSAEPQLAPRAVALKAVLGEAGEKLTAAEMRLLSEWLDRLAAPPGR